MIPLRLLRNQQWIEIQNCVKEAAKDKFIEDAIEIQDMMTFICVKLDKEGVPAGCGLAILWDEYEIPQLEFVKMPKCYRI